ncbi:MAG: hypothetical protein IJU10_00725 [Clostridia bacterium]|nr:hypothetical protein [Clostridia bacterium]
MKVFRGGGLELHFIEETFSAERILIRDDTSRLNWAKGKVFGLPSGNCFLLEKDYSSPACFRAKFLYFSDITTTVTVDEYDGAVRFSYLFRNEGKKEVTLEKGDLGVSFPFNDTFDIPSVTLRRRVHSFIRTDGATYVRNARVSGEPGAVSLIMTKGECFSYGTALSAFRVDKGEHSLEVPALKLTPTETYEWEFLLFTHRDERDFLEKAKKYGFFVAEADGLVGYEGDVVTIRSDRAKTLSVQGSEIPFVDGMVSYALTGEGESALTLTDGDDIRVFRSFTLARDLFDRRVDHLLKVRQVLGGDARGAFTAYDHTAGAPVTKCGAALAETTAMPLLFLLSEIARGREGVTPAVDAALAYYDKAQDLASVIAKGKRDEAACSVYATVKYEEYLYRGDAADLMASAMALSSLFGETDACVPTSALRVIASLRKEGKDLVAEELTERMISAADRIIANGNKYDDRMAFSPLRVCGALFLLSDVYLLTGKEYYLMNAREHFLRVEAFFAASGDYRTNELPTLMAKDDRGLLYEMSPTVDAVLFALALERYACCTGDDDVKMKARNVLTSLLTLFAQDGSARRGVPCPDSVNDKAPTVEISWAEDVILYLINLLFERE